MSLRVLFMGMLGAFSAIPFERLIVSGADVCAVFVPSPSVNQPLRALPVAPRLSADMLLQVTDAQHNIVTLARDQHIPTFDVSDLRHARSLATLADLRPAVFMVACFPFILPAPWLRLPTHGGFNLHPSLLPQLRGPAPLFWTFHEAAAPGVTLHRMSARADAGDIVAQTPLTFPDGITYSEGERLCAEAGAALMVDALRALERGALSARAQDERGASAFPSPSSADFVVTPDWSARRAFNFMRGMMEFGQPLIQIGDEQFVVREAIRYTTDETMGEAYRSEGERVQLRFADGSVVVTVDVA
ncbi:MAG: formyltransferase family protein [Chloroflexota bacterium]